jgi:hypothetical protein
MYLHSILSFVLHSILYVKTEYYTEYYADMIFTTYASLDFLRNPEIAKSRTDICERFSDKSIITLPNTSNLP